jgi:DNA-binding SARP family transcriptional activator
LISFGLLGPVIVRVNEDEFAVPSGRQRVMLAAMLVDPGRTVPADEMADLVWDGNPPDGAADTLRTYVMRLRRALGPEAGARILTRAPGYVVQVEPGEVDTLRFAAGCRDGHAALRAGRHAEASTLLQQALGLWRGEPLEDVPSERLRDNQVRHLAEQRLQALHWRIDADLERGMAAELIPELRTLLSEHPLHEHFHAQLMTALVRCGRRADALDAYRDAREILVQELGIEPSAELRELQQRILSGAEQPLDDEAPKTGESAVVPRQLPVAPGHFTGRAAELALLDSMLDGRDDGAGVPITAMTGMAGVGKTALALRWAHREAHRFPDGQLYANLRGFHPRDTAATVSEVIRNFLDAFGIPAPSIPVGLDAQAGLYRSLLAGKRVLVILDNARDSDQVRPLLPGDGDCAVIVTSRSRLTGLVAAEGARPLALDVLDADEAGTLLRRRVGAGRIEAEPRAASDLAALCGGLPLALNVVAARAVESRHLTLGDLAAQLDSHYRLNELNAGDEATSVRSVFSWSYRQLSDPAARLFRLLALHPGPDICDVAVASLAGLPLPDARQILDEITRAHLLTERENRRFTFHDLLRAYAGELASSEEDEASLRAATSRCLDYYLYTANQAAMILHPLKDPLSLPGMSPDVLREDLHGQPESLAWFETEHRALMALIAQAAETGFDRHAWQIPATMMDFFDRRGHWHDEATALRTALAATRRLGDLHAQGRVHRYLARVCGTLGSFEEAESNWAEAIALYQRLGDALAEAYTRIEVRWLDQQGRYSEALEQASIAAMLFRTQGFGSGAARALNGVGWCHAQLGDYQQAIESCRQALELFQDSGDELGEAQTWDSLGYIHRQFGQHDESIACYERPLQTYLDLKDRYHYAATLVHMADTYSAAGREAEARASWAQARRILDDLHHPEAEIARAKLMLTEVTQAH